MFNVQCSIFLPFRFSLRHSSSDISPLLSSLFSSTHHGQKAVFFTFSGINGWVIEAVSEWASERKSDRIFSDPFQRGAVLIVFYLSISKTINLKLEYSRNSVWQISWLWVINTTGCPIKKVHVRIAYLCISQNRHEVPNNCCSLFYTICVQWFDYLTNKLFKRLILFSNLFLALLGNYELRPFCIFFLCHSPSFIPSHSKLLAASQRLLAVTSN